MSVFINGVETINGCPVIETIGDVKIIHHPIGYMAYHGYRLGTRATIEGARALASKFNQDHVYPESDET